jgi:hypothetical protein
MQLACCHSTDHMQQLALRPNTYVHYSNQYGYHLHIAQQLVVLNYLIQYDIRIVGRLVDMNMATVEMMHCSTYLDFIHHIYCCYLDAFSVHVQAVFAALCKSGAINPKLIPLTFCTHAIKPVMFEHFATSKSARTTAVMNL